MGSLWPLVAVLLVSLLSAHCDPSVLERRTEARQLAAALDAKLSHAVEASNRAILADTDEASKAAVDDAHRARAEVMRDVDAVGMLLEQLGFTEEQKLIADFKARFVAYDVLDRSILELAVKNTNLKAMRLSYGPVHDAADAFARSAFAMTPGGGKDEPWHTRALVYQAVSDVREVQALEGPHIAEPKDEAMTRLEQRMDERMADAREVLKGLEGGLGPTEVAPALQALERFADLHHEVIALSRENTNVRALALTLGQKRTLAAGCTEALRALAEALDQRVAGGTR